MIYKVADIALTNSPKKICEFPPRYLTPSKTISFKGETQIILDTLGQRWATLFGSRST